MQKKSSAKQTKDKASKYIKKINERIAATWRFFGSSEKNPLSAEWSRTVRKSGLEFTQGSDGRYKILNTAENREKVSQLEKSVNKRKPRTVGQYHAESRDELERQALEIEAETGKKPEEPTQSQVEEYSRLRAEMISTHGLIELYYGTFGADADLAGLLSEAQLGISREKQDKAKIDYIIELMRGQLDRAKEEAKVYADNEYRPQSGYPF